MRKSAKLVLRVVVSLAVSGVFIYFSLRHTNIAAVGAAIRAADPWPVFGYLIALLGVHLVKTVRWGLLLKPLGDISFKRLNSASAVGLMLMVILPLRLGELARPLLVARNAGPGDQKLPRSGALASILVERIVDSIAIGVLGLVALRTLAPTGDTAQLAQRGAVLITAVFGVMCLALIAAFFMRERAVELTRRLLKPVSFSLSNRAARLLDGFIRGLHLGSVSRVLTFLALTVIYWSLHLWGFWAVAGAFGLHITGLMACTVLAFQVVGIMIPAGPGMVGTSQFFTQLALGLFVPGAATSPEVAARIAGYGNTLWMLQFGQQVLTGLLFLAVGQVSLANLFEPWQKEPEAPGEAGATTP
jgi:uncharacterized protein (TIRG00374 family)